MRPERLTSISHWQNAGATNLLLRMDYVLDANGSIITVTESDQYGTLVVVDYTYDNLNRLIIEVCNGQCIFVMPKGPD